MWARNPHNYVSKSFSMTRLNFGQGVGKGATYRQSALIPTCDAPILVRTLIMHTMRTTKIRDSLIDTTTRQKTQIQSHTA